MHALITGVGGFVGGHLARLLLKTVPDIKLHGTVLEAPSPDMASILHCHQMDLKDYDAIYSLLQAIRPDYIYHLAAQAFVPRSFEDPWETMENNIRAQLNIIQACLALNLQPRILVISSAEIYGTVKPEELPLAEDAALRPSNPYSVSKVTQDMLGLQYHISHHLPIMRVRPFNHIGPGQSDRFVAPAFAMQIARIETGQQDPIIYVGNLSPKRDFTDVRDIVRAYQLVMEKGAPGAVYNIASGTTYSIQQLLDTMLSYTDADVEVRVDESRLRPVDNPIVQGDATRLRHDTGWAPTISFEQTLRDVLADCRQRIH